MQGIEGAAQLALEIFVVLVKGLDVLGWGSQVWFAGAGENGFDDFLAQDQPATENADARRMGPVASRFGDALDELLATELHEIVGGLTPGVAVAGDFRQRRTHFVSKLLYREPVWIAYSTPI